MSAIRDRDNLPDDLLSRLNTRQQQHWERSREHRREAMQCLVVTWDEAERRALQATQENREVDMVLDPRTGTAAIVEWDNPEAYIEADDTATRSVVQ